MRQLLPALVASTALHVAIAAAVQAQVPRASPPPAAAPRGAPRGPVEIEVFSVWPDRSGQSSTTAAASAHATARRAKRRQRPIVAIPVVAPPQGQLPTITAKLAEVSAAPSASVSARPAAAGPASGSSDLDLSAFFQRLQRAAQRCSGPRAGEGKVRFCVGADGVPTEVSLVQSTGNFALDDAALHCVVPGAAPFPRTDRCLVVPLRFQ